MYENSCNLKRSEGAPVGSALGVNHFQGKIWILHYVTLPFRMTARI